MSIDVQRPSIILSRSFLGYNAVYFCTSLPMMNLLPPSSGIFFRNIDKYK